MKKPELVYRIGTKSGFFSEYNLMVLAMIYSLEEGFAFRLCSRRANFAQKNGWCQFFLPFCEEDNRWLHGVFNRRFRFRPIARGRLFFKSHLPSVLTISDTAGRALESAFKRCYGIDLTTSDVVGVLRDRYSGEGGPSRRFELPEIGIKGDFLSVTRELVRRTYRFNSETESAVKETLASVSLPDRYVGIQVRGGDKRFEVEKTDLARYIEKAESLTDIRAAFLSTDDFRIFEDARRRFKQWEFVTLCEPDSTGYDHRHFMKMSFEERLQEYYNLFACVEILKGGDYFVGTFSSNIGMFLGMCMPPERCHAVDFDSFHFWWPW